MSYNPLPEEKVWVDSIRRLEKTDKAEGGPLSVNGNNEPLSGHMNHPLSQLASRTAYLKDQLEHGGTGVVAFKQLSSSGGIELDITQASMFRTTLVDLNTNLVVKGQAGQGLAKIVNLIINQGAGARKINWPKNIKWANDREPVLSYEPNKEDTIVLFHCELDDLYYGVANGGTFG